MNNIKRLIITHKGCMDGLASAYVVTKALKNNYDVLFVQYNEEDTIFEYLKTNTDDYIIYFTDFSLKTQRMEDLSLLPNVKHIFVFDHHKTAESNLANINNPTIVSIFRMENSGVGICLSEFDHKLSQHIISKLLYIEDRDLWSWKLPYSREVNEALRFLVKPNDLGSFTEIVEDNTLDDLISTGQMLIQNNDNYVKSKLKHVVDIKVNGVGFKATNSTTLISELGNAICREYDKPALLYFINENNEVVCSLRSLDHLDDVSVVAQQLNGGGHRNASGFTISLSTLEHILTNKG